MKKKTTKISLTVLLLALIAINKGFSQDASVVKNDFIFNNPPFSESHSSTIESTPYGIIAAWFAGSKEGNKDVEIWTSHYKNNKWSEPKSVANGIQHDKKRYPCWNPVLYQVKDGPLLLFYKVGPSPSAWWGMLMRSSDGGATWTDGVRLPEDILGPVKNKPFMTNSGKLICPSSTEVSSNEGWKVHFEITEDLGRSWHITPQIIDPDTMDAIQPSIISYKNGAVLQMLARSRDGGVVTSWSHDEGNMWTPLAKTGLPNPNSGTDAVTLQNGLQLLVYNHSDRPKSSWSGRRAPLNVAVSVDGVKWYNIIELEKDRGSFSYPAVIQSNDGMVHITYTWYRKNIKHVIINPDILLKNRLFLSKELKEYIAKNK